MKLTEKQKRFADEYIKTGNATQSAIKAGYSKRTAKQMGVENLSKPYLSEYIKERLDKIESERLMSVEEALILSSEIARGVPQKGISRTFDNINNETVKDIEYEYTPDIESRQRAIEHILKVNGVINGKLAIERMQKEIEMLDARIKQIKGVEKDTSLLNHLIEVVNSND
ncbi:terminase small subunit [Macrococcoides canis]|uniref:terminase small subunit n=1 Tax=Macrococcoides canis TaxID=1855823 RepID=UPI001F15FA1B|nr:terminase small subunit [Macrococcus canis]UJS28475.1 terminase small subunit [Macrococcus canis]